MNTGCSVSFYYTISGPSSVLDIMIKYKQFFQLNIFFIIYFQVCSIDAVAAFAEEISEGFKIFQESVRIFYTEYFLKYLDQVLIIGILFSTIKIVSELLFKWKI